MKSKIGVVIATYNGEKYLETQLISILTQTRKPDLIVVSDGGSSDNSVVVAHRVLTEADVPFRILESDVRIPVAQNFERALNECDADIIFFADQDDKWLEQKIECTLDCMEDGCCMAFSDAYIADGNLNYDNTTLWQQIGYIQKEQKKRIPKLDNNFCIELIRHNVVTGMCMCINSELKSEALPFPEGIIHDYWLAHVALNIGDLVAINKPLTLYRQHGNNVVGTTSSLKKSYSKRFKYIDKICANLSMFERLEEYSNQLDNQSLKAIYHDYIRYIKNRILFITNEKRSRCKLSLKDYSRYEYKKERVIIRDLFTRLSKIISGD